MPPLAINRPPTAAPARLLVQTPHTLGTTGQCVWNNGMPSQFAAMRNAYADFGGMCAADEWLALCATRGGPDVAQLARWIVERKVIGIDWQKQLWLPLFQFCPGTMRPRSSLRQTLAELSEVLNAWDLAVWFARPNPWLAGNAPLAWLSSDMPAVCNAARFDRFIAHG